MRLDSDAAHPKSPSALHHAANGSSPLSHKTATSNGLNGSSSSGSHANGQGVARSNGVATQLSSFYGHDREEVARILIQGLQDLGYNNAASTLSRESGFELESMHASAFRAAVLSGEWADAEQLLLNDQVPLAGEGSGPVTQPERHTRTASAGSISRWDSLTDPNLDDTKAEMLFLIRQQKYLELLEKNDTSAALLVLRNELQPLHQEQRQFHALSSLMFFQSPEDLKIRAGWDGAQGESRRQLLSELSRAISPSAMIPEHRLATLFDQHKESQILECVYHNTYQQPSLYTDHVCDRDDFPSELHTELDQHSSEVWFCAFSNDGTRLATASKDKSVMIYDTTVFRVKNVLKEHSEPVAYIAWSPDDTRLVSCSQDGEARLWDTKSGKCLRTLQHQDEPVSTAAWAPDGLSFVTSTLDLQRSLSMWSLDSSSANPSPVHTFDNCGRVQGCAIASLSHASSTMPAVSNEADDFDSATNVRLVAFCTDKTVHVFDYARREKLRQITLEYAITCLSLSSNGQEMLMNLNCGELWTIGVEDGDVRQKYFGQQQGNFMIRSCLGGATEGFVVSGGEDGRVRVWHRHSGRLIEELDGHRPTCVNAVAWNKARPGMFASVSDDGKARIWATPHPKLSQAQILEENRRSHNMLPVQEEGNGQRDLPRWERSTHGELGLGPLWRR